MQIFRLDFFVVTTFSLYIGIAIFARAKTTDDFYVAGHDVPPLINGMATAADWMSAASFISMAGLIAFLWAMAVRSILWGEQAAMFYLPYFLPLIYVSSENSPFPILLAIDITQIQRELWPQSAPSLYPSPILQAK